MMKSMPVFCVVFVLVFSVSYAEIYIWTDKEGTTHFTEDLGTVPAKYRNTARKVDESEQTQSDILINTTTKAQGDAAPDVAADAKSGDELYDGKSYEEWQKEFAARDAAMIAVQKRIDEIAEQLKHANASSEVQKKLFEEYNPLYKKLKVMKAEYYQQVELARKAGLTINIQEQ